MPDQKKSTTNKPQLLEDPERSKRFLLDPQDWGLWPYCPLKNRNAEPYDPKKLGVVVAREDGTVIPVIFHANLFRLVYDGESELLDTSEKTEYVSIDALLEAGWVVD